MTWGAVAGGVATVVGGYMSSQSAGDAAGAQIDAANEAGKLSNQQYYQNRTDLLNQQRRNNYLMQPYQDAGYESLAALQYGMGLGDPNATARTSYHFDAEKFKQSAKDYLTSRNPVTLAGGRAKWNALPADKREIRLKAYNEMKKEYSTGLAGDPFRFYKKLDMENKAGWVPQESVWKTGAQTGVAGETGDTERGKYGFGDYGFLTKRFGLDDFQKEPGYEFRRNEGNRGIQSSAAARGGLQSGAALKALNRFNQDYASSEYGNAYNRFTNDQGNIYNRLAAQAGTGQTQTNQVADSAMNTAQSIAQMGSNNAATRANYLTSAGDSRASGYMGQANATNAMWQNLANVGTNMWAMNRANSGSGSTARTYNNGMVVDY